MSKLGWAARLLALGLLAILTTGALAGPARVITGASLGSATLLALAAALVVVALAAPVRTRTRWADLPWIATAALFAVVTLGSLRFGPLVGFVGADGGIHVQYQREFVSDNPRVYFGFAGFYGFVALAEKVLGGGTYEGFAAGFLVVAAIVGAAAGWCSRRALDGAKHGALALVVTLVVLAAIALPVLGYYQMDGFYAQLFVLVPLVGLWLVDVAELSRVRRAALLMIGYVAVRYTYGLVLSDLFVLALVLVVREAVERPTERRFWIGAGVAVALGVIVAEYRFFSQLVEVVRVYGWFIDHRFWLLLVGMAIVEAGLVAIMVAAPAMRRLLFVPVVISVTNTATIVVLGARYGFSYYYLFKYDFHAIVLLSLAAIGGLVYAARATQAVGRVRIAALAVIVGLACMTWANEAMRVAFDQRALGVYEHHRVPQGQLKVQSLVDTVATRAIAATLREQHARFGGYLVSWGPMFNFVNASFDRLNGGYFAYRGVDRLGGSCVFWSHRAGSAVEFWTMPKWMQEAEHELDHEAGAGCERYTGPGDRTTKMRELCRVCFPPTQEQ